MTEAALAIALPLAACLLAVPLGRRAVHLLWVAVPAGLWLALRVHLAVPGVHAVGGWDAPLGIVLRADGLAAAFLWLSALVAGGSGIYAARYFAAPTETRANFAFWPLFFAVWASVNAVFLSGDLFNLYVALELLTLAAVAMVALDGRSANFAAAIRYLLFALFGSLAFLLGAALIYGAYGTLDMGLLGNLVEPEPASFAAAALISVGLFAKAAVFPFHAWLPPAHSGAPAPASALLSALVVKAGFYIVFRLWFDVFPPLAGFGFAEMFGLLGTFAVLFGAILAFHQQRLKMIVAYSTVAQIGYLFLVFPLAGMGGDAQPWAESAWSGGVFHALAHGLAKAAMFLAAGAMLLSAGDDRLANMAGLGKSVPIASFAFGLAAVSLIGLPPSGGFLAKYLMLTAAFTGGQWWWAGILVIGGLLSAAYLFRPINRMIAKRPEELAPLARVHWSLEVVPLALAVCALLLGLASMPVYALIQVGSPLSAEFAP